MICKHERASIIVFNDLAKAEDGTGGGRLVVSWCDQCGAVRRDFPNMRIDWELPRITIEANQIIDWKHSG